MLILQFNCLSLLLSDVPMQRPDGQAWELWCHSAERCHWAGVGTHAMGQGGG